MIRTLICIPLIFVTLWIAPTPASALEIPAFEHFKGPGDVNIVLVHDDSLPYMKVLFSVPVGSLQDPSGKEGVSTFAAQLLSYGTDGMDQSQVAQKLDGLGATFQAWSDQDTFAATGDVATLETEVRDEFLTMFLSLSLNPSLSEDALRQYKKMHLGKLQNLLDDNAGLATRAMHQWALPKHPYGRSISGTLESIERIQANDLKDFHRRYVIPEHAWLFIAGDIDRSTVERALKEHQAYNQWAKPQPRRCVSSKTFRLWCDAFCLPTEEDARCVPNQRISVPPVQARTGPELLLIDKNDPELSQIQFRVSFPLTRALGSEAWFGYRLGVQILGGDYTARMNRVLRIEQGLTYGARISSSYSPPFTGTATLQTYTKPSDVRRAIDLALVQMKEFSEKGPSPKEIDSFKDKIVNQRAFLFEKIDGLINQLYMVKMYQLGLGFIEQYEEQISKVTAKQAQTAVQEVFQPKSARIVIVGNASDRATYERWMKEKGGTVTVIPAERVLHENPW